MSALSRPVSLLLNLGHALDHLFLLIFATAVSAIAADFGFARWEDLMPYGAGAFLMFGVGSLPAGKLGDGWGRRPMMLVFFFGTGASALLCALARNAPELAAALTVMGLFSSIYHPVGIPMLVQSAVRPGAVIGVNGLAGNMGIALAALVTGFLVEHFGWRTAFVVPGLACLATGVVFWRCSPRETESPSKRGRAAAVALPAGLLFRVVVVLTLASVTGNIIFSMTTNGNGQLLAERLRGVVDDPAALGALLAGVYAVASFAQLIVGRLIDRMRLKTLQLCIVLAQAPLLLLAARAEGWWAYAALMVTMALVFGNIPFTDATIVRYVDDRMRSRVAGMRLAVGIGISSAAVWALGPAVKAAGFSTLLVGMAGVSLLTAAVVAFLPDERRAPAAQ